MNANEIKNRDDFYAMTRSSELVIVTTYRGAWCPFCRKYLKELEQIRNSLPVHTNIIGLSIDNVQQNQSLQEKLGLGFKLIPDPHLLSADILGVATGNGHGKERYLQPSVFIYRKGVLIYEWIQKPTFMNLGGAINRLPIKELVMTINALHNATERQASNLENA